MKIRVSILFLLFFAIQSIYGQKPTIYAEKKEINGDILKAYGNVEVIWKEYRFFADYIEINQKENTLIAKGRVTISSGETVVSGDKLTFNIKNMTGEMVDTQGVMQPSIRYKMDQWVQVDKNTQKFKKMDFTSCSQCVPRWKISCKNGKIKKDKYIEMKNVVLKIKKIPILYLPWLRYPIQKDGRATGFLFPLIGISDRLGVYIKNAFFWDIKSNVDLTLLFDYYKKAGMGMAEEFRYLFKNMHGNIRFYYFKHLLDESDKNVLKTSAKYDYIIKMGHHQKIDFLNTNIKVNVDRQSDPGLLRLHQKDYESYLMRRYVSEINLSSSFSNLSLNAGYGRYMTIYPEFNPDKDPRDPLIRTYFPKINFGLNKQKIWKIPGYFSLDSGYRTLKREGDSFSAAESIYENVEQTTITINPLYSLKLLDTAFLKADFTMGSKHSYYSKSKDPETGKIEDEWIHLSYNTVKFDLTGPEFYKIFGKNNSKIKHIIEPKITVRYISDIKNEDRLVKVDRFDNPSFKYIGFKLESKILLKNNKYKKYPLNLLVFSVSQDYYFEDEDNRRLANRTLKINGEYPSFSELTNRLVLQPFDGFSIDARARYNYYRNRFSYFTLGIQYNRTDSFIKGGIFLWRSKEPYDYAENYLDRTKIRANLDINIPHFPLSVKTGIDYDFTMKEWRYISVIANYDYQCVNFGFNFRLYPYDGDLIPEFTFGVNLGNLGMVKNFLEFER